MTVHFPMAQKRDKVRPDSVNLGMGHLVVQYGRIPLYAGRVGSLQLTQWVRTHLWVTDTLYFWFPTV